MDDRTPEYRSKHSKGLSQFAATLLSPFETQFGTFIKDLERFGQVVRDEISLASKQVQHEEARLQVIERREASLFRSLGTKFRDRASQEQREAREWRLQAELRNRRNSIFLRFKIVEAVLTRWCRVQANTDTKCFFNVQSLDSLDKSSKEVLGRNVDLDNCQIRIRNVEI